MMPSAGGSVPFTLLRLLADGGFRSGEALAAALGCSRATVWNRIRAAEALGVHIQKLRGRGYRLAEPLDLLDARMLESRLRELTPRPHFDCLILDECASTSTLVMERVRRAADAGGEGSARKPGPAGGGRLAIASERQTAGRGRRGAAWHDAPGGSLAVSVSWRFARGIGRLSGLSLAVAVAAARAMEKAGCRGVKLKWPNDLMLEVPGGGPGHPAAKLGGILTEIVGDPSGPTTAVIGIGLNVRLSDAVRGAIGRPVADLAREGGFGGPLPSRTELLAMLLAELGESLACFEQEGFGAFRAQWLERHAWQGRRVALQVAERQVAEGEALGVDDDGALLLASRRGLERFHSGELSLRPA